MRCGNGRTMHQHPGDDMAVGWKNLKYILIIAAALLLAGLAVVLLHGFVHGDISGFRTVVKSLAIIGALAWLHEKWSLHRQT